MSATYKRVQVKVGAVEFWPVEATYTVARSANHAGRPTGDSLQARASVWLDVHDTARMTQDQMIQLWKKAVDPKDNPEKVSITYFAEDDSRVLTNVEFMGWISSFQTVNPSSGGSGGERGYNNILHLELVAALDEPNVSKHKLTK